MDTKRTNSITDKLHTSSVWRGIHFVWALASLLFAVSLVSCSDDSEDDYEWANWQSKNDTYWTDLYAQAQQNIAAGDTTWKIIPCWTLANQKPFDSSITLTYDPTDYIIVHVVDSGTDPTSPMLTDSVRIHYLGRMIPSPTYTDGYIFDASYNYNEPYNLSTMRPMDAVAGVFIKGFTTALLNMHRGDRWTVYVPYNLAYGSSTPSTSTSSSTGYTYTTTTSSSTPGIQPYSNLIFDITLVDFYKPGQQVPKIQ